MFNAVILVQNIKALYPNIPQLDNGVCHGLSVMYVNAVLCKQVELFEEHYSLMSEVLWFFNNQILYDFNHVLAEAKRVINHVNPVIRAEARKYIDASIFCDGVIAHQGKILEIPAFSSQNILRSTHMLLPNILSEESSQLHKVYSDALIGDKFFYEMQITNIIAAVQTKLKTINKNDFAIVLTQYSHAISLSYNASANGSAVFSVFDQNLQSIQYAVNIKEAVAIIYRSFYIDHNSTFAMSLTVYTTPEKLAVTGGTIYALCEKWYSTAQPYLKQNFPGDYSCLSESSTLNFELQMAYVDTIIALGIRLRRANSLPEALFEDLEKIYCITLHAQQPRPTEQQYFLANKCGATLISIACLGGHLSAVQTFFECYGEQFNRLSALTDLPPCLIACMNGHLATVKFLLQQPNVEVNLSSTNGNTPFIVACQKGHLELVRVLIANQRIRVNHLTQDHFSPLLLACQNGHVDVVKLLLANPRVSITASHLKTFTPLYAACRAGHLAVVNILLADKRININQSSYTGGTPFLIACQHGHVGVVKCLLESPRILFNAPTIKEAINIAYKQQHHKIIDILINTDRVSFQKTSNNGIMAISNIFNQQQHVDVVHVAKKRHKIVHVQS